MSAFRDSIAPERRPAYDAACEAAGEALAAARAERDELYVREGAEGVARAACPHGSDAERARAAAAYERMREQTAAKTAA